MSYLSHYLAQVAGPCIGEHVYTASDSNITVDDEVFALIALVGGGGGGALAYATSTQTMLAQGGAAGGFVLKLIRMKPSVIYNFTMGSGGAARASNGGAQHGNAGSSSTFESDDLVHDMEALGGAAGTQIVYAYAGGVTQTIATKTRVSGTGGHYHYEGGSGGSLNVDNPGDSYILLASGGGGVNIWGFPGASCDGGDITTGTGLNTRMATGGGGCAYRGGDIDVPGNDEIATGGGGTGSNGVDTTATVDTQTAGGSARTGGDLLLGGLLGPEGTGGDGKWTGASGGDGGDGGGGGGCKPQSSSTYDAGDGGIFGGGGGCCGTNSGQTNTAGNGLYGGGGGGLIASHSSSTAYLSGAGGNGILMIRYFAIPGRIL